MAGFLVMKELPHLAPFPSDQVTMGIDMGLSFWIRRSHKWIALVIGVQALLWMASGVYMTVVPISIIHGDHLTHATGEPLAASARRIDAGQLMLLFPGISSFRLKSLLGREVFEIERGGKLELVEALDGKPIGLLDETAARALASESYHGDDAIVKVELLAEPPGEVGKRQAPIWAVHYGNFGKTTLYFSPHSGELLARRHELWRWFDFLFMLHIMDYDERSDVNNTLLRVASIVGLLFALSGLWLLLFSFRRRGTQ